MLESEIELTPKSWTVPRRQSEGKELERVTLRYGSECAAVQVPRNTYHTFISHEDGTVIFEAKDRPYNPQRTEEFLRIEK